MSTKIFAYSVHSEGAHNLAEAMDVWMVKHNNSRYVPRHGDTVINWGRGRSWAPARTLNNPDAVARAVNKLRFFNAMTANLIAGTAPRVPAFTTNIEQARQWCGVDYRGRAKKVVVRRILDGHEGRGIEIHTDPQAIPQAPLYTKYVPKTAEYRIHIVGDRVIDSQRKVLRRALNPDTANWDVRNTANGFVFQREGINVPNDVTVQARLSIQATGLDFGAVDVVWNERRGEAYVLEVNTAPGIEGTTVNNYAHAFRNLIDNRR